MPEPIEFFFDFSSPYAYFAAHKVDDMCSGFGRDVAWKPFMLGAALKITGAETLTRYPLKGDYCRHDWARIARFQELPWSMPERFPIATLAAARAFYWIDGQNPAAAKAFAWSCFKTYFGDGHDISEPSTVGAIAAGHGFDENAVIAAVAEEAIKQRLKDETAAAVGRGVFGSPFIIVDGEAFWGSDRLWMVKRWLRSGGW
ncbi:MAG: 2-hydroxychromene-2-carboxylate isomerase [Proteobacteria bacterium]|nr:2-hydroxychromene-2-carboxylate isomerase [Pseudomonadota bacterium]